VKKSAAAGYPEGQHVLACCQLGGSLVEKDEKSAVELFKMAATTDSAKSQYELGAYYEGVEKDVKQAEHWYLKAAESGEARAQLRLGYLYKSDEKLTDLDKSIEWYEKAYYSNRRKDAAQSLAVIFDPVLKNKPDFDQAIQWAYRRYDFNIMAVLILRKLNYFDTSAIKGCYRSSIHRDNKSISYYNLAQCCSPEPKIVLLRRAGSLGDTFGMFEYSRTLPDDNPKRLKYLQQAAAVSSPNGLCPQAQWELGQLYESGRCGLEKNAVLAKEWKDKALANGFKPPA
jgi:TPR repeat protein